MDSGPANDRERRVELARKAFGSFMRGASGRIGKTSKLLKNDTVCDSRPASERRMSGYRVASELCPLGVFERESAPLHRFTVHPDSFVGAPQCCIKRGFAGSSRDVDLFHDATIARQGCLARIVKRLRGTEQPGDSLAHLDPTRQKGTVSIKRNRHNAHCPPFS